MSDTTPKIKWEDPPASKAGRIPAEKWTVVAQGLRENPGRWARVLVDANPSTGTAIKNGRLVAFTPPGTFEAVARNRRPNRRADIYARYIGAEATS